MLPWFKGKFGNPSSIYTLAKESRRAIEEARENDYNLNPSRYVSVDEKEEIQPVEDILVELGKVEEERERVDREMKGILTKIGFEW